MRFSLKNILLSSAVLAMAASIATPAAAQSSGRHNEAGAGRQAASERSSENSNQGEFRAARNEARQQGRVERAAEVPAPRPRDVQAPDQSAVRRLESREARTERPAQQARVGRPVPDQGVVRRLDRRTAEAGTQRQGRDGAERNERREGWRARAPQTPTPEAQAAVAPTEQGVVRRLDRRVQNDDARRRDWQARDDRRDRVETGQNRREWRARDDNDNDRWRGNDGRNDRWRDARRHDERERWRRHYRWPTAIVHPSTHYVYRPHWWGQRYFYFDNRYRDYGYDYGSYYRPGYGFYGSQRGSGWSTLYPWLRDDPAGRHWVMWNFDDNRNGSLNKDEARQANYEFTELADRNRDGYLSDNEIDRGVDELRDEYRYSYQYG